MSFFYNKNGDKMKIYIDFLLFLNFAFDFLLLLSVSVILKRNAKLNDLLIGAFIGSLTIFALFLNITSLELFIIKVITSVLMVLVSFKKRDFRYFFRNLFFFYMASMVLGGVLYYLNNEFSLRKEGIIFINNGLGINFIFLCIFAPIIIYIYIRQALFLKENYHNYYEVSLFIDNCKYDLTAFLDTGNNLLDPYFGKPILLLALPKLKVTSLNFILVPYKTAFGHGLVKCLKPDKLIIKGVGEKQNFLVGLMDEKIPLDGIDCLLSAKILEGK